MLLLGTQSWRLPSVPCLPCCVWVCRAGAHPFCLATSPTLPWFWGMFTPRICRAGILSCLSFEDNLKIDEQSMETSSSLSEQFSAQSGKMSLSPNMVLSWGVPAFRTANDFYKVRSRIPGLGVGHLELHNEDMFLKRKHYSGAQRIPEKLGFEVTSLCASFPFKGYSIQ